MWWNAIAGAAQGYFHGQATRAQIAANNRIGALNAEVSNKLRQAGNLATAAQGSLARWVQSVNNQKVLDSGGDGLEANSVNYRRMSDASLTTSFRQGISDAEQMGAMAAAAAMNGVEGNVVDMVNGSVALRDSIVRQRFEDIGEMQANDAAQRAGRIMSQMIGGLDNSLIVDSLDYNVDVAQQQAQIGLFSYALRGMAEHMGGGGAINSGRREAEGEYQSEVRRGSLTTRQRSSSSYDLADHAYDTGVDFSFKLQDDEEYSPYSIYGSDVKLGEQSSDRNSFWSF